MPPGSRSSALVALMVAACATARITGSGGGRDRAASRGVTAPFFPPNATASREGAGSSR